MAEHDDRRTRWFSALGTVVTVAAVTGAVLGAVTYGVVRAAGLAEPSADAGGAASPRAASGAADLAARPAPTAARDASALKSTTIDPGNRSRRDRAGRRHEQRMDRRAHRRASHRPVHSGARHQPAHRTKHESKHQVRQQLTLSADRHHVRRMGRVHLFGSYRGHAGTILVVQRLEHGRWTRFPVTVVVRDGRFRTWVASGRPGANRFRVRDPGAHRRSTPVNVTIR